ncbi:ABC transporter permease [Rhodoplanes sp. Z2-YC6860]|uniref:ABC transporter permease n=1 Tax=Rhodoplanes sp. Z2-YC6860 TaxID=674703 RepID=UPI00078E7ED4|nr:ABC transporter permease [Rhodoplanes sp. Z2-YC6860]AMN39807.1 nitrate/sulfonate/bicarbonate ABC transporter permease [Rhodoplanes sp. Z2-YC6860]
MTRAKGRRKDLLIQVATHASVLIAWELLSRFVIPPQFLPPPSAIAAAFVTTARSGELPRQLLQTANVLLLGFGLAIVTGMALGIAMGMFKPLRRVLDPYVNAFYAMPTVAMVPLVIIWLGLGFQAKVFLTWLVSVFPVVINTQIGVMNVPPAFIETARAFGCDRWQLFRRVILQAAIPFLIAGIRLALGRALVGVVVAEMFTALTGLGSMIVFYGNTFRTAELFVPMVVLAVLSIALTNLIYRIERWIAPWRQLQG